MKSHEELLTTAVENTQAADEGLKVIHRVGIKQPVPPTMFTIVLQRLNAATDALTELERRARGGEPTREER